MNPSRARLGPEPDPAPIAAHGVRYVEQVGRKSVATCRCGWRSGRRATATIARESLAAHVLAAGS